MTEIAMKIPPEITAFYNEGKETSRLFQGLGRQPLPRHCHAVFSGATQSNWLVSVMRIALSRRGVCLHDGYKPLR